MGVTNYMNFVSTRRLSQYHEDGIVPIKRDATSALEGVTTLKTDFAQVESSDMSTHNYDIGDYLIFSNYLCKVIKPIQAGESLVVSKNIRITNITTEMETIKDEIPNQATDQEIDDLWDEIFGS